MSDKEIRFNHFPRKTIIFDRSAQEYSLLQSFCKYLGFHDLSQGAISENFPSKIDASRAKGLCIVHNPQIVGFEINQPTNCKNPKLINVPREFLNLWLTQR